MLRRKRLPTNKEREVSDNRMTFWGKGATHSLIGEGAEGIMWIITGKGGPGKRLAVSRTIVFSLSKKKRALTLA